MRFDSIRFDSIRFGSNPFHSVPIHSRFHSIPHHDDLDDAKELAQLLLAQVLIDQLLDHRRELFGSAVGRIRGKEGSERIRPTPSEAEREDSERGPERIKAPPLRGRDQTVAQTSNGFVLLVRVPARPYARSSSAGRARLSAEPSATTHLVRFPSKQVREIALVACGRHGITVDSPRRRRALHDIKWYIRSLQ